MPRPRRLIAKILGQFGVSWVDFPSGATREEIDAAIAKGKEKGRVSLIYLESPANPTNQLVDVEAVRAARDAAFGRPISGRRSRSTTPSSGRSGPSRSAQGADLSVYSLTKYVGGHSDLVAGGLVGEKGLINQIRMMRNTIGTICDPNTAWMLLRSLETLELRMSRAGENAAKVCDFLRSHPKVEKIGYLGFLEEGSRQADIFQPPLHRRRLDLLALPQGRREGGVRLPRRAADRQSRGQPRRHRDARQRARRDDPSVGARRAQEAARHHPQPGAHFDRRARMPTTSSPTSPTRCRRSNPSPRSPSRAAARALEAFRVGSRRPARPTIRRRARSDTWSE